MMSAPIKVAAAAAARIVSLFGWVPASRAGAVTGLALPPVGSVVGPDRGRRCGRESFKPVRQSGFFVVLRRQALPHGLHVCGSPQVGRGCAPPSQKTRKATRTCCNRFARAAPSSRGTDMNDTRSYAPEVVTMPIILTGPEIRAYLRIDSAQLSRLANRDEDPLPARKSQGMGWRARRADLDDWLDRQGVAA
ncbi:hypothetical protein HOU25_gp38 [Corynebacterium phage Juicebox]|uniref:Helix-turn-helix domain-containing protein n=1 Tax=Corynebacterium phage Juicebox TaxID=2301600 RepID=A0A385UJS0_9CAUD|nr:hypothetical protein HOU25_gp38 [Corynebacterium phage Juicebox]AYB69467.1 hypothetical protein JUICEBOX_38 [Corynebacterium phage Juicebox]